MRAPSADARGLLLEMCGQLKRYVSADIRIFTVTVGIGPSCADVTGRPATYESACLAAETGRAVVGPDGLCHYEDLGVYQLLAACVTNVQEFGF